METIRTINIYRRFLIGIVFFWLFSISQALAAPSIRHHDLQIKLFPEQSRLVASDHLSMVLSGNAEIALELSPAVRVTGMNVEGREIPFLFKHGRLFSSIPTIFRNREISVIVRYQGEFRDPVPNRPLDTENPSYGVADTILPQGVFLSGGSGWYPDVPGSRASFHVRIEAPEGMEAITSGRRLDQGVEKGRSFSTWESSYPLPSLTLSAAPYRIRETHLGKLPIYTYFYPQSDPLSTTYLAASKGFLKLYQGLFGPYPFEKFAVAENFFPTGYGFPSWTLLGKSIIGFPFIVHISLGHEIAHSWWGNGVWVDTTRGNWSEGLTTYVADYLYQERSSPEKGLAYRLKILRDYATLVPPGQGFPLADFTSRTSAASQAIGYGKGAMVFHMARVRVGDEAFWAALRQVAHTKLFQRASWSDFAAALSEKSHRDMRPFFRQWVERPGAPVLRLENVRAEKTGKTWQVHGTLVQSRPFFTIDVPIWLETGGEPKTITLASNTARTPFTLRTSEPPRRLQVDPQVTLFRRLDPVEIPPMVNGIRGSTSLMVVAAGNLPPKTLDAAKRLLPALGQTHTPILNEADVDPAALQGHDVLFLGLPSNSRLLGKIPPELRLEPTAFSLQGTSYHSPGDTLFVVLPHPTDPSRMTAVFLPFSASAADKALRKIPHYGRYSYLVFHDGTNQDKGTWPITHSPLIYEFAAK